MKNWHRGKLMLFPLLATCITALHTASAQTDSSTLRVNQIQVLGTHNSYHAGLTPALSALLKKWNPEVYAELEYQHPDLHKQLDHGIRQLELDIFADSHGGLYAHPSGASLARKMGMAAEDEPVDATMLAPGIKVMHVQDLDYRSNCQPFTACLREIHEWSLAHPQHLPIFILIETKEDVPSQQMPMVRPEAFDRAALDELDKEIRSVFPDDAILTPDKVRGKYKSLEQAVLQNGWPTLQTARGKVIFLMDQRTPRAAYLEGHPNLQNRILFTNAEPGEPDAAFVERNEGTAEEIQKLVRAGYLVRTRADEDTHEARRGDTSNRDRAIRSGAQLVSTDYPASEPAPWNSYQVQFPEGLSARCNPVNAPVPCHLTDLTPEKEKP